jgi:hypothetical protein
MSLPWDSPPLPSEGDANIELTYAGVGRVMSEWEGVEVTLSHLYTHFIGKPFQAEAMQEYGISRTFQDRFMTLEKAVGLFCDQSAEADFDSFLGEIKGYAARRNDIAHGIVRPWEWFNQNQVSDWSRPYTWWLVPSHYKPKKTSQTEAPAYAYTRPPMEDIANRILNLNHRLTGWMRTLFPPRFGWGQSHEE